jgi:hypothetical protein
MIDILILTKNEDGTVDAMELSEVDDLGSLVAIEAELAELLAEDDVEHLAAAMDPGSVAGVLIWENLWAAPFASAARRSGGQLDRRRANSDPGNHRCHRGRRRPHRRRLRHETSTSRPSRGHWPPGRQDRRRRQSRHARTVTDREDCCRRGCRHAGAPPSHLTLSLPTPPSAAPSGQARSQHTLEGGGKTKKPVATLVGSTRRGGITHLR